VRWLPHTNKDNTKQHYSSILIELTASWYGSKYAIPSLLSWLDNVLLPLYIRIQSKLRRGTQYYVVLCNYDNPEEILNYKHCKKLFTVMTKYSDHLDDQTFNARACMRKVLSSNPGQAKSYTAL